MTDRALNFREIVDAIRQTTESPDGSDPVLSVTEPGLLAVCQELRRTLEDAAEFDHTRCEYYMSLNTRREMERRLAEYGPEAASMDFLERQIRTDVSMPDETVLFMHPDAVTLGGTVTGSSPIGVGTISDTGST